MVQWSVPGWLTGTRKSSEKGIISFKYPDDPRLKRKWLRLIGLESVKDYERVCQKHFISSYFLSESENVGARNIPLSTPKLRKDAVPTIFDLGPAKKKRDRSSDSTITSASFSKLPRIHTDHSYGMDIPASKPPATTVSSSQRYILTVIWTVTICSIENYGFNSVCNS